jgi:hypothetical protein
MVIARASFVAGLLASGSVIGTVAAQAAPTWHLQLDHAIRPAEGTVGEIGDPSYLAVTSHGDVYVAERKAPRVTHYDARGNFVGVVMREGEGPKETRAPELALQGDTLVVFDPTLGRLTRIAPRGTLVNQRTVSVDASGFPVWTSRDGSIWIDALFRAVSTNQAALRVTSSGRIDTVAWNEPLGSHQFVNWMTPTMVIKGGPFSAAPFAAIDPAGHVVFGGSRTSRWYVVSGRDTIQQVVLPEHLVTIPRAVRDSAWDAFIARLAKYPGVGASLHKDQLPTTLPAWLSLDITPRGEWWIGRPGMDGKLASWDIVANGKLVGHVAAPPRILQGPGTYDKAFGADLVALVQEDENDVPWIGVYRIVRNK